MSKRALKINAYLLSPTCVVERNRKECSRSKKAIGFLTSTSLGMPMGSLTPVVEKIAKRGAVARKQ